MPRKPTGRPVGRPRDEFAAFAVPGLSISYEAVSRLRRGSIGWWTKFCRYLADRDMAIEWDGPTGCWIVRGA
jgi:hypothetical protein